jgi:hypothetical protein
MVAALEVENTKEQIFSTTTVEKAENLAPDLMRQ